MRARLRACVRDCMSTANFTCSVRPSIRILCAYNFYVFCPSESVHAIMFKSYFGCILATSVRLRVCVPSCSVRVSDDPVIMRTYNLYVAVYMRPPRIFVRLRAYMAPCFVRVCEDHGLMRTCDLKVFVNVRPFRVLCDCLRATSSSF